MVKSCLIANTIYSIALHQQQITLQDLVELQILFTQTYIQLKSLHSN